MNALVIGSGPAGVSVARALLARGRSVTLIDGGKTLEADRAQQRDMLAARSPQDWEPHERAAWQAPQFDTPDGQVRRYGSDFAMEPPASVLARPIDALGLRSSRAVGGLSNLWGAAVLPYRQADLAGWPIRADDLAPHYRAVAQFMPVAGEGDDLAALFDAFEMSGRTPLPRSAQAVRLLERLAARREKLAQLGVSAGAARLAVDARCRACGMCLHGCPWGYIWSAAHTLEELIADERFSYQRGRVALRFAESADGVEVTLAGGDVLRADRLFLAAGVLESARILLASQPVRDAELELLDSQHAFLPMVQRRGNRRRPDRGAFTTLPQLFAELDAPEVSPHLVHAQIYTWNEFFARDLIANYGFGLPPLSPILKTLARRLIVAQLFLHSDHSGRISLRLAGDGRLEAGIRDNPDSARVLEAAKQRFRRAFGHAGLTVLGFASRMGAVGSSFHVGGSVPMAADPASGQSDRLGRPQGLERVHLVDASVFPSIPATTITFSVMANAHRIGAQAP